jgi:hypothetical protein
MSLEMSLFQRGLLERGSPRWRRDQGSRTAQHSCLGASCPLRHPPAPQPGNPPPPPHLGLLLQDLQPLHSCAGQQRLAHVLSAVKGGIVLGHKGIVKVRQHPLKQLLRTRRGAGRGGRGEGRRAGAWGRGQLAGHTTSSRAQLLSPAPQCPSSSGGEAPVGTGGCRLPGWWGWRSAAIFNASRQFAFRRACLTPPAHPPLAPTAGSCSGLFGVTPKP